jgi:hypothetical protein
MQCHAVSRYRVCYVTTVSGKQAGSYMHLVGMICPASVVSRVPYNPDTYNAGGGRMEIQKLCRFLNSNIDRKVRLFPIP